jgi:menaquinone-dependent protoporphyrinogen IX oxidase
MKIEYLHASKYGNGALVADEFKKAMAGKGVDVDIHHIREVSPSQVAHAEVYVFSSPGRFGKPIRGMRRFLQALSLPAGTRYAVFTTEAAPKLNKKTGKMPTEEELVQMGQRVRPVMNEILEGKGLVEVAEDKVYVTKLKGPLEDGGRRMWRTSRPDCPVQLQVQVESARNRRYDRLVLSRCHRPKPPVRG